MRRLRRSTRNQPPIAATGLLSNDLTCGQLFIRQWFSGSFMQCCPTFQVTADKNSLARDSYLLTFGGNTRPKGPGGITKITKCTSRDVRSLLFISDRAGITVEIVWTDGRSWAICGKKGDSKLLLSKDRRLQWSIHKYAIWTTSKPKRRKWHNQSRGNKKAKSKQEYHVNNNVR